MSLASVHLIQLTPASPADCTGSVRQSQKPDLESDGKITAVSTIPLWPSPQQPIPGLASTAASTRKCGKTSFFPENAQLFFSPRKCRQLILLIYSEMLGYVLV